jgi:DNA helicase-2/ATP-dependent DNA helicase PcrA
MTFSLSGLNEKQGQAVQSDAQQILILAGAGSGKTRTLTTRIAYLIQENGVHPGQMLAVTFTNKAAREMRSRLDELIQADSRSLWVGTFHSICARILRTETDKLPLENNFTIYDTDDQVAAIKKVMSSLNIAQQLHPPKMFQSRISKAKNKMVYPDELERETPDEFEQLLPDVYRGYQNYLRKNNAVDFDDLLLLPIELFDKNPQLREKYQKKFKHIFIDEYQDTNRAQYELVRRLVSKDNNICVVGDEDQSIYRWRGADINNILNFSRDFPGAETFRLEENYRSNQIILSGANALVAHNTERIGKNLWTKRDKGDSIVIMDASNETEEARLVLEKIHNEMYNRKRSFKDIAILYRTNAQSRALEDELRRNAISYSIIGGVRFYERKEVKDVVAYLKVISNPNDSVSLRRIVNFPLRGIGDTTVGKIEKYAESVGLTLLEGMGKVEEIPSISQAMGNRVLEFYQLIMKYRGLSEEINAAELASSLAEETGIITHLKNEYDQYESESRQENLNELFNTIQIFTNEREAEGKASDLTAFLEDVSLVSDVDSLNGEKNTVTLMTLHSSKGLEFPVVFITGLEMGLFPLQRNSADPSELEEERRLLYVGMTRAEENLYLTFAHQRRRYNAFTATVPSLFLDEIPSEYTVFESSASKATSRSSARNRSQARRKKIIEYFQQEDESQDSGLPYSVGSLVYHSTFGKGKVKSLEGSGDKAKIEVVFEGNLVKKLIAQYANLTPLEVSE